MFPSPLSSTPPDLWRSSGPPTPPPPPATGRLLLWLRSATGIAYHSPSQCRDGAPPSLHRPSDSKGRCVPLEDRALGPTVVWIRSVGVVVNESECFPPALGAPLWFNWRHTAFLLPPPAPTVVHRDCALPPREGLPPLFVQAPPSTPPPRVIWIVVHSQGRRGRGGRAHPLRCFALGRESREGERGSFLAREGELEAETGILDPPSSLEEEVPNPSPSPKLFPPSPPLFPPRACRRSTPPAWSRSPRRRRSAAPTSRCCGPRSPASPAPGVPVGDIPEDPEGGPKRWVGGENQSVTQSVTPSLSQSALIACGAGPGRVWAGLDPRACLPPPCLRCFTQSLAHNPDPPSPPPLRTAARIAVRRRASTIAFGEVLRGSAPAALDALRLLQVRHRH